MEIKAVDPLTDAFNLTWMDGSSVLLPFIWLRDNDPGELHPHTRERTFDLTTVDLNIQPLSHSLEGNALLVQWPGRAEPSRYTTRWLRDSRPGVTRHDASMTAAQPWTGATLGTPPRIAIKEAAQSPASLLEALQQVKRYGLVIFEGLDDDKNAGERFAEAIGFKRETNFGIMFEVINEPSPNNLAYTSLALPLHTDLCNQESIPGYQFLHCWRNTVTGGESRFADGKRICADLRAEQPEQYQLLASTPIPWRFHDSDADIRWRRPIIEIDDNGNLVCLAFNAHIADTPDLPSAQLPDFYRAYRELMLRIRSPDYGLRYGLRPGEMVMFDNRRVLHGREAFDANSGERHFRGFYIEHNEVDSRMRVLSR